MKLQGGGIEGDEKMGVGPWLGRHDKHVTNITEVE